MSENDPIEQPEAGPGNDKDLRLWATLLHLSVLAGFVVPFAGLVVPIVIYILKKDELPGLQPHFNVVINWIISLVIYAVVCAILVFVIIGVFLFWVLALIALVFPIIGAIKANDGEVWNYPLSIPVMGKQ
ncbi:MAG: DUF4870 domain-containing protein [Candidatus Wenzhouxiangella sp. M2_3B_020]